MQSIAWPARGYLIVRDLQTEERYRQGRIVLPELVRSQWAKWQVEVLAVGRPSRCTDERCRRRHQGERDDRAHPMVARPGDWVLVGNRSLQPTETAHTYLVGEQDVWGCWR